MQYIKLGDLKVSRFGFGCDPLGGHAWGMVDPVEVERSVGLAVDLGVTLFDTADCYGRGQSETRLARAAVRRQADSLAVLERFTPAFQFIYLSDDPEIEAWARLFGPKGASVRRFLSPQSLSAT